MFPSIDFKLESELIYNRTEFTLEGSSTISSMSLSSSKYETAFFLLANPGGGAMYRLKSFEFSLYSWIIIYPSSGFETELSFSMLDNRLELDRFINIIMD